MRAAAASIKSIFALTLFATNNYDTNVAVAEIAEIASVVTNETWPLTCVDNVVDTTTSPITTNNDDDFSCDVFCGYAEGGAPSSVSISGSRVLIDDSANMVIMQYQVCACDYFMIGNFNDGAVNITFADGQKACKFDEKELVFPTSALDDKNDTVSCSDIGLNRHSDCDDYCKDVVFKDFAPDSPVSSVSVGGAIGSSDFADISGCTCSWEYMQSISSDCYDPNPNYCKDAVFKDVAFKDFAPDSPVSSVTSGSSDPAYIRGCTCPREGLYMVACSGAVGAMQFSKEFVVTAIGGTIMAACVMFL